jgi:hypothetical protein
MATSTNYGWAEPDNSSLVKNGASDIRTLGNAIDTSVWNVGFGQAGKNKVINGDMDIWQRGTSFTVANTTRTFTTDRWAANRNGGGTFVVSQQAFTPATAPVAGYESEYFLRLNQTVAGAATSYHNIATSLEDVRIFAGQTATFSFWAKADSARIITPTIVQSFGSGGSADVTTVTSPTTQTLTTSWARYSYTVAIPSISGKTVGTGSSLILVLSLPFNSTFTIDFWGVQLEYGSVATPFQTASGGSPQAELAMCQRYYWRFTGDSVYQPYAVGTAFSTTVAQFCVQNPVPMRIAPTSIDFTSIAVTDSSSAFSVSAITFGNAGKFASSLNATASSLTQFRPYILVNNNSTSGYLGLSAEL